MNTNRTKILKIAIIAAILLVFFAIFTENKVEAQSQSYTETSTSNSNSNSNYNYNENNNSVIVNTSGNKCGSKCNYPPLAGSCSASISRGKVGDVVTWKAVGTGGSGYYSFYWSGTDGLYSLYPIISKKYNSAGTKTATVEITSNYQTVRKTCTVVIEQEPTPTPDLAVSCSSNPSNVRIGQNVNYSANVSGGSGSYSYSWSGSENLSSSNSSVSKSYQSTGSKNATVTVTSGNQTRTATCSAFVENDNSNNNPNLEGYCEGRPDRGEEGDRITWTAYPDGGDGNYDYDWSGTDNLDGDDKRIFKRYNREGTKTARVTISSDEDSITRTCTVRIDEEDEDDDDDDNDDLDAYCKGTPENGRIGDRIRWTVYPDGGDGDYEYDWDGDDNLRGDDKSIYKTYSTSGRKDAEVEVESDGDRVTARCSVDIEREREVYTPPTPSTPPGGIYLSSIPATGLSNGMKTGLLASGLTIWSAFMAYLYIARRNEKIKEKELLASIEE